MSITGSSEIKIIDDKDNTETKKKKTYQGNSSLVDKQEINIIKQKILYSQSIEDEFGDYLNLISHKDE